MTLRTRLQRFLHRTAGYDIRKFDVFNSPMVRRTTLLRHHGVGLVLDVGAHVGDYARDLRYYGYRGRIVSFEPLPEEFRSLDARAQRDPAWEAVPVALGAERGSATLHVGEFRECSSLLDVLPAYVAVDPSTRATSEVTVPVEPLDALFGRYHRPGEPVFLKADVQGYERQVIEGARESLPHIVGMQLELSLERLYEGGAVFLELLGMLDDLGFALMSIEPTSADGVSGKQVQVDGVFFRRGG